MNGMKVRGPLGSVSYSVAMIRGVWHAIVTDDRAGHCGEQWGFSDECREKLERRARRFARELARPLRGGLNGRRRTVEAVL